MKVSLGWEKDSNIVFTIIVSTMLSWETELYGAAFQLRDFSQSLFRYDPRFSAPPTPDFSFPDWEAPLDHLAAVTAQATEPQFILRIRVFQALGLSKCDGITTRLLEQGIGVQK